MPIATNKKILVIEDEPDIQELLSMHVCDICDEVVISGNGNEGLSLALSDNWLLIILDLRLPGVDGLEICRQLRAVNSTVPLLMLTAKSSEIDRVLGLELGADDYLTKPFSILELMARLKGLIRRTDTLLRQQATQIQAEADLITVHNITMDTNARQTWVNDNKIELTAKEFDLLMHFIRHPGKAFSRTDLLRDVWGYSHSGYQHTVNSHINRLRAKIEPDPADPTYVKTVWGIGYRFSGEANH